MTSTQKAVVELKPALCNVRPTILVGLGGTGKGVLMRLRQRFFARYGTVGLPIMAYRVFDTSNAVELAGNTTIRENDFALRNLWFKPEEFVPIDLDPASVTTALTQRLEYPHIASWAHPNMEQFASFAAPGTGAGQMRPYGRLGFYFAYPPQGDRPGFLRDFTNLVNQVTSQDAWHETQQLTRVAFPPQPRIVEVIIVTSLAGGTGSGMFLDAAYFARSLPKLLAMDGLQVRVTGYLVLPSAYEAAVPRLRDKIFANGYGALKELEHFMTPDPDTKRHREFTCWWEPSASARRTVAEPAFDECWLVGNNNDYVTGLNDPDDVTSMIADHLYLKFQNSALEQKILDGRNNVDAKVLGGSYPVRLDLPGPSGHPSDNTCLYLSVFGHRYWSLGLAKVFVDVGRIRNGAASLAAERALDLLLAQDKTEPQTRLEAVTAIKPYLDQPLVARLARVTVAGRGPQPVAYDERIRQELRSTMDALLGGAPERKGRAEVLEAKVQEVINDYVSGESSRQIARVTSIEAAREAVATSMTVVSSALVGRQGAPGSTEAAKNACNAISAEMALAMRRYGKPSKPSGDEYRRGLRHLTAAEGLPVRRTQAIRTVLAWTVEEAVKYAKGCVDAEVQAQFCSGVSKAVIDRLGSADGGEGRSASALANQLADFQMTLLSARRDIQSRVAAFIPDRAPSHSARVVELPYKAVPWEQVKPTIETQLAELTQQQMRLAPGQALLDDYFRRTAETKTHATLVEELFGVAGTVADSLWRTAHKLVYDAQFAADVDAARTFVDWEKSPGKRKELLKEVMHRSFPWWRLIDLQLNPPAANVSHGRYTVTNTSLDAEIEDVGLNNFQGFKGTTNARDKGRHVPEEVVFVTERSGVPLLAADGIAGYRQSYDQARQNDATGADFANRHIDRAFIYGIADIRKVDQQDALRHFEALEDVLLGLLVGSIWRENGQLWVRLVPRDSYAPPSNKMVGVSYRGGVRAVFGHDQIAASVRRANDDWIRNAGRTELARLRALAGWTYNHTFPERHAEGDVQESLQYPERDAIRAILRAIDQEYLGTKGTSSTDPEFQQAYDSAFADIEQGRLAIDIADEWGRPEDRRRIRTLRSKSSIAAAPRTDTTGIV